MKSLTAKDAGVEGSGTVYRNLPAASLVEAALRRKEGHLSDTGALVIETGKYTGRSPDDKFIVDTPAIHGEIAWGKINVPISPERYEWIKSKVLAYLQNRELFVFDGFAGADPRYRKSFRVVNETASQNLFIRNLLIRPDDAELERFEPDYTIWAAPGFRCDPDTDGVNSEAAILINYTDREVVICGSGYCGEIKKSVFSVMNYVLPKNGILPMHCSANIGSDGSSAVFFGLSGTGKTTLSADPARRLIGDDEHGWSPDGIFNIEGGCYAKCIGLEREREPQIFDAIRFGTLLENVIVDQSGHPDYSDGSLTENTRAGYPVDFIPNAAIPGIGGIPKTVIFLTADAFGVIPPISRLDNDMAMYHFVSGYTSKLAGTERGIIEPQTTFSTLFGAPFFPLRASVYAEMLGKKIRESGTGVFLVNTGWCGGAAGTVPRMKLSLTRAMVSAALAGELDGVEYVRDPIFNVNIPLSCPGVPAEILDPRNAWADRDEYEKQARALAKKFADNFASKYPDMPANITAAGPRSE